MLSRLKHHVYRFAADPARASRSIIASFTILAVMAGMYNLVPVPASSAGAARLLMPLTVKDKDYKQRVVADLRNELTKITTANDCLKNRGGAEPFLNQFEDSFRGVLPGAGDLLLAHPATVAERKPKLIFEVIKGYGRLKFCLPSAIFHRSYGAEYQNDYSLALDTYMQVSEAERLGETSINKLEPVFIGNYADEYALIDKDMRETHAYITDIVDRAIESAIALDQQTQLRISRLGDRTRDEFGARRDILLNNLNAIGNQHTNVLNLNTALIDKLTNINAYEHVDHRDPHSNGIHDAKMEYSPALFDIDLDNKKFRKEKKANYGALVDPKVGDSNFKLATLFEEAKKRQADTTFGLLSLVRSKERDDYLYNNYAMELVLYTAAQMYIDPFAPVTDAFASAINKMKSSPLSKEVIYDQTCSWVNDEKTKKCFTGNALEELKTAELSSYVPSHVDSDSATISQVSASTLDSDLQKNKSVEVNALKGSLLGARITDAAGKAGSTTAEQASDYADKAKNAASAAKEKVTSATSDKYVNEAKANAEEAVKQYTAQAKKYVAQQASNTIPRTPSGAIDYSQVTVSDEVPFYLQAKISPMVSGPKGDFALPAEFSKMAVLVPDKKYILSNLGKSILGGTSGILSQAKKAASIAQGQVATAQATVDKVRKKVTDVAGDAYVDAITVAENIGAYNYGTGVASNVADRVGEYVKAGIPTIPGVPSLGDGGLNFKEIPANLTTGLNSKVRMPKIKGLPDPSITDMQSKLSPEFGKFAVIPGPSSGLSGMMEEAKNAATADKAKSYQNAIKTAQKRATTGVSEYAETAQEKATKTVSNYAEATAGSAENTRSNIPSMSLGASLLQSSVLTQQTLDESIQPKQRNKVQTDKVQINFSETAKKILTGLSIQSSRPVLPTMILR